MNTASNTLSPSRRRWLTLVLLALAVAALLGMGATTARQRYLTRGIPTGLPEPVPLGGARLGVNVYLDAADDAELRATLAEIRGTGIGTVKQAFPFREAHDWTAVDRIMAAAAAESLIVVPLLDGDPQSAFAPPDPAAFATWAGAFAGRYGNQVDAYICLLYTSRCV